MSPGTPSAHYEGTYLICWRDAPGSNGAVIPVVVARDVLRRLLGEPERVDLAGGYTGIDVVSA